MKVSKDDIISKEPIITSNQTILKCIDYYMKNPSLIDFLKQEPTWKKLTSFLSFYTPSTKNDSIPNMKLSGKYELTQTIKKFINQISDLLNTSKTISFNIIGDCFLQNPKMARYFDNLEIIASQSNNTTISFQSEIIDDIIYFYYNERLTLIDIIIRLLDITYSQLDSSFDHVRTITNDLIMNYDLFNIIWQQFVSYAMIPIKQEYGIIDEEQLIQILKEQKKMLDCMIILNNIKENCNKEIFIQMLQYFGKTGFTCYFVEKFGNNNYNISDIHRNELEDLIGSIIEKSVLLTMGNFVPFSLYEIITDNSKPIEKLKSTPMEIPFDNFMPFINNYHKNGFINENFQLIKISIKAIYSLIKHLQKRGWLIPSETQRNISKFEQIHFILNEENAFEYLINMLSKYSNNVSYDYITNYYKYVLMKWVNLIIMSLYENDLLNYPKLIQLTTLVLDSPLTRDEFFYREKKNESLIYKMILLLKEHDISNLNLLNLYFSLSESKKRSEYNEDLLSSLTNYSEDHRQKPFFADVFTIWENMNNNLKNNLQYEIMDDDETVLNTLHKQIQTIRLFLRLYSTVPRSDEMIITMNLFISTIYQKDFIIQDKDKDLHFTTLLHLILQSLSLFTNNRELYISNINIISEMYNTLIEMFHKPQSNLYTKYTSEYCDKLCTVIFNSISNDLTIKDYTITVKAYKLIKTIFEFENIISFIKINNKSFISNLFYFVINAITAFNSKTSFNNMTEIKLIKELCNIMDQLYSILITNVNKTKIYNKNVTTQSNMIFEFICSLVNQVDMSEFLINYLQIKVKVDSYQPLLKNKFTFVNKYLDLLMINLNEYNSNNILERQDIMIINKIKKMLCENIKCLNTILDLVLLYKRSNDKTLYELNIVKKWNYSLFISKNIPSLNCDSSNVLTNYDVNLIMLLFIYSNFEIEYDLPLDPYENDNFLDEIAPDLKIHIKHEITLTSLLYGKFITDTYLNVSTLSYSALCKLIYLFQIETKEKSIFNIMNYIYIKKSANVGKEGIVNIFEIIKENIIRQLLQGIPFLSNEILKFLCICTNTQVNFISSMLEDFSYTDIEEKKIWEVIQSSLPKFEMNPIDDTTVSVYGYTIMFISKVIDKDVLYKKPLKDFFKDVNFKNFMKMLINDCLQLFIVDNDKINHIHDQVIDLFSNYIDNMEFYIQLLNLNHNIKNVCFNYIIVQNMCFIYKKLITFTDLTILNSNDFVYEMGFNDFIYNQLLKIISSYKYISTKDENSINDFNKKSNEIFQKGIPSYSLQIDLNQMNIKFDLDNANILLSDHNNVFGYGYSYYIDLKELYTQCVFNDEYLDLFREVISQFCKYNLSISVFEARTQAMYASTYLIGLMFTIGPCGYSMSTCFFTGVKVYEMLNIQKNMNNDYYDDIGNIIETFAINNDNKITSIKLNFNIMTLFNENEMNLVKFVNNEIIKRLILNSKQFINETHINFSYTFQHKNIYLISLNYNILNYILDYMLYKLKINPEITLPQNDLLSILSIILSELDIFTSPNIISSSISIIVLSLITSLHCIFNYFLLSKYKLDYSTLTKIINPIMLKLTSFYNKDISYRAIITFTFNTYLYLIPNSNDKIIFHIQNGANSLSNSFITTLMSKINENITDIEYQSLMMLLISLLNKYPIETFELFTNMKIFYYLKMVNSFKELNEYEHNERSSKHILWCWTLKLISTTIMKYISLSTTEQSRYDSIIINTIEHFLYNEERIISILSNCDYVDSNKNKISKSLAFIEEVNMVCEVIASVIMFYSKNKVFSMNDNGEFYYKCVEIFLEKTLMLFTPNMKVYKLYKSNSIIEKKMEELHLTSNDNKNDTSLTISFNNDVNASNYKKNFPLRLIAGYTYVSVNDTMNDNNTSYSNTSNKNIDIMAIASSKYKSNISNLFTYRIEQLLNHILFNITTSIRLIMNNQQYSYRQYIEDRYNSEQSYLCLDGQLKNIMNSYYLSINLLENMVQMNKIYQIMYNKAQLFYDNISICNKFGFLNSICEPIDNKDMFKLNNYNINNLLHISVSISECFKSFTMRMQHAFQFETQFKEMMVKPLQGIINKMEERDQIIKEMKGVNDFTRTAEWVKKALI